MVQNPMPCSLVDHFTHSRTCRQMKMKAAVWNVSTKSKEPQVRGPHGLDAIFGHSNWRIAGAAQLSCTTILDIRISNRCVSKIYLPSNNGYGKCPPSSSTWRKPRTPTKSLPSLPFGFPSAARSRRTACGTRGKSRPGVGSGSPGCESPCFGWPGFQQIHDEREAPGCQ